MKHTTSTITDETINTLPEGVAEYFEVYAATLSIKDFYGVSEQDIYDGIMQINPNEDETEAHYMASEVVIYAKQCQEFEARQAAASVLGSIKSDKKASSSRENGKKGGRPKKQSPCD